MTAGNQLTGKENRRTMVNSRWRRGAGFGDLAAHLVHVGRAGAVDGHVERGGRQGAPGWANKDDLLARISAGSGSSGSQKSNRRGRAVPRY